MELLDVYDKFGNVTGRTIVRGDKSAVLSDDEHIAVAVIYIENSKGEFLIQKTSLEKGGEFSSTGGHVCANETPLVSIKREVLEEIGINIEDEEIIDLGYLLYDKPLRYMFYLKKDINLDDVKVEQEEVEYVKYMSVDEINQLIENNLMLKSHGIIFKEVLKYKENKIIKTKV